MLRGQSVGLTFTKPLKPTRQIHPYAGDLNRPNPLRDNVFPFQNMCLTVVHEEKHEYGYTSNKSYSLWNDTCSEMGKYCHAGD